MKSNTAMEVTKEDDDDDDCDAEEKEEEQEKEEEEGDDADEEIANRPIGIESLICKHRHQRSYVRMTHAVQQHPADNSYDVDKLEEEEDKKTNGAVVANDQRNAEAEIDEEEGSADSDVNEGDSAHNNEEDDESQVT